MSGIHQAILGREWLTLRLYKLQLVLYVKSQNCPHDTPHTHPSLLTISRDPQGRYGKANQAGSLGEGVMVKYPLTSKGVCFLQGKVSFTRPHAQVI